MSFKSESRFQEAIRRFDALNAQDPNRVEVHGEPVPKELHDALAMTRWLEALHPEAGEAAHLAARCQHLCRWEVPRKSYPEGRAGYHRWRNDLKKRHAKKSAEVLRAVGYDEATIAQVGKINLKEGLRSDPAVQQIEDALCLVFLETQFEGYLDEWEEEKTLRILQKTWAKMSERAHPAALALELSPRARSLLERALAEA
ncbi:MAG: DUF4202 domain-containing protein [Opitutales bacterium]